MAKERSRESYWKEVLSSRGQWGTMAFARWSGKARKYEWVEKGKFDCQNLCPDFTVIHPFCVQLTLGKEC